jgi:hypothetical protein
MTEQDQGQSAPQTPAPTEAPRTTTEQQIAETRKAAQGEVPPFFGSGTVEAPASQAAPAVAPTAPVAQHGASANTSDSSGDGS